MEKKSSSFIGYVRNNNFWVTSAIMVFKYATPVSETPVIISQLWHLGAAMTCLGAYWFWFFLRVDVAAEGHKWYRVVFTDMFVCH